MRKIICIFVAVALLCAGIITAVAADLEVIYTPDSKAEVGSSLTVDKAAMLTHGSNTAETYNALLEGNVIYRWYKDDALTVEGLDATSYPLLPSDAGSTIYVKIFYYDDATLTNECGVAVGKTWTIPAPESAEPTPPTETTPATDPTTVPEKDPPGNGTDGSDWWVYVAVSAAAMVLGIGVALLLAKRKR